MLSTKLEFQKGQVKFSIPSIPSSRPQPSCDPPRLLISFSTLFRPTYFHPPLFPMPPAPLVFLPLPYTVCHLLHFSSFVSSTSMKRFVHRFAHLYSSYTNRSGTHCTLLWRTINSRLTLGETDGPDIPGTFLRDFHDRLPAACTEHMYTSHGVLPFPSWIKESRPGRVNRFHTTSGILYVCIRTFTWVVHSFNECTRCTCSDRTDSNKLHRRFHMDCIEEREYILRDETFRRLWEAMIPRRFPRLDRS